MSCDQQCRTHKSHRPIAQAFEEVVEKDEALAGLQGLLPRLNAYDATLVDEPDYDVRLAAFAEVNEVRVPQYARPLGASALHRRYNELVQRCSPPRDIARNLQRMT
jgi:hypothetical protein